MINTKRLAKKYHIKTSQIKNGEGYWNYSKVEIFLTETDEKLGEYIRMYHAMYNTFYPFEYRGKDYAFYSDNYEQTVVMSLPDCKEVARDKKSHFCPVDYTVPYHDPDEEEVNSCENFDPEDFDDDKTQILNLGLVSGCVWGDDSGGWKLRAIDLSKLEKGKIKVIQLFGYCELGTDDKLDDVVGWSSSCEGRIHIPLASTFQFDKKDKSGFLGHSFASLRLYQGDVKHWGNYEVKKI